MSEKPPEELKESINMFNMDYDAGSMSISKGGFSHVKNPKGTKSGHNISRKQS